MFFKYSKILFSIILILSLFFSIAYSINISSENSLNNSIWPTPGYKTITSDFGLRIHPTTGLSSYHSGIDIGAPEGCRHLFNK